MLIKKETSLEIQSQDTKETLNWKLEQLTNNNLPVEQGMADYIYFGVSNIDAKIKQLKAYKDEILKEISSLEKYQDTVKEDIADWIQEQGVEKLNGIECSSITINKEKEETEETKETKETTKFVLDVSEREMQDYLVASSYAHWEKVSITKVTLASKDKIRINSKRK